MPRALYVLVFVLAVAGCTAPPGVPPEAPASPTPTPEARVQPLAFAPPEAPRAPPLQVSLTSSDAWLKPFQPFEAVVDAPEGAHVAWFAEHEAEDARPFVRGSEVYVLKASTVGDDGPAPRRARAELRELAPDGVARDLRLAAAGRYVLDAEGARLAVNVYPGAPRTGSPQTLLLERDGALRFEPPEIDIEPGGRALVWSQAPRALDVREAGFAVLLPLDARASRVTPVDEGLYRLHVLAVDERGARGIARAPFLVDFERPASRLSIGPARGSFLAAEAGADDAAVVPFTAAYPMRTLRLDLNVTTAVALPASVELVLARDGDEVARISSLATDTLELADLPAGAYAATLRGEHGAMVAYELSGEAAYRLPTPDRLRAAQSG